MAVINTPLPYPYYHVVNWTLQILLAGSNLAATTDIILIFTCATVAISLLCSVSSADGFGACDYA